MKFCKNPIFFIFSLVFIAVSHGSGQTARQHQAKYPFINWEAHQLKLYGDTTHFNQFYSKLEQLIFDGFGQIHVVHIGGSHVQAGTMSRQMRENLHQLSPALKGERGFMFPYHLAKTNNPYDYKAVFTGNWEGYRAALSRHEATWGIAATAAETRDYDATVTFFADAADGTTYDFQRVRIFFEFTEESYEPYLPDHYDLRFVRADSGSNYVEFILGRSYDTLTFHLRKTNPQQVRFNMHGIQFMTGESGITYHSIGANGASVPTYLRCQLFSQQLAAFPPDLVIFGIGINDANKSQAEFKAEDYKAHYRELMNQIRAVKPDVCFLFITNNDSYYLKRIPNPNALRVKKVMEELAQEYNGAVWDLFEVMGGLGSSVTWERKGLMKADKIHMTPEGYRLQADLMSDALRRSFGQYLSRRYIINMEP
jgi:lysophospholipase L1-like esterase